MVKQTGARLGWAHAKGRRACRGASIASPRDTDIVSLTGKQRSHTAQASERAPRNHYRRYQEEPVRKSLCVLAGSVFSPERFDAAWFSTNNGTNNGSGVEWHLLNPNS